MDLAQLRADLAAKKAPPAGATTTYSGSPTRPDNRTEAQKAADFSRTGQRSPVDSRSSAEKAAIPDRLNPAPMTQSQYDQLPPTEKAKYARPDEAGKRAAFRSVRKALAEALKRTDLTTQEHYDLNTPYQALGAHDGPVSPLTSTPAQRANVTGTYPNETYQGAVPSDQLQDPNAPAEYRDGYRETHIA